MKQHPVWLELINTLEFDQISTQFPRTAGVLRELIHMHTPEHPHGTDWSCPGCGLSAYEEPASWPSDCRTTMLLLAHFGIDQTKQVRHLSVVPEQRNGS